MRKLEDRKRPAHRVGMGSNDYRVIKRGCRRATITFDQMMFDTIRERAIKEGTCLNEQVRTLIEWGLESADNA